MLKKIGSLFFFVLIINFAFTQIDENKYPYQSITYKGVANVDLLDQMQVAQFQLVNVIDSFVYIVLHIAGLEVARAMATPTEIIFINKLQKNYYKGDYTIFQKLIGTPFDFYFLQDIFNGRSETELFSLAFSGEQLVDEIPFITNIRASNEEFLLELEIKRVVINNAPNVSVSIPNSYKELQFN